jgi:phosphoribosylanthranilate isomerase
VLGLALETRPDYVQLHCGENLEDTARIVGELDTCGVKVIKTVFPGTPKLGKIAEDFCKAGVYALLFDPRTPDNAATGGSADLTAFVKLRDAVRCPVILAGGIHPGNVLEILQKTEAHMIDLMTGVELCPGIKDEAKVISLFRALQKRS